MELSKQELESVIEKAVTKALDTLGLDMTERQELRKDFIYLRTRRLEMESLSEDQRAWRTLDRDWVRKKRTQADKRVEFVKNHIAKAAAITAIGLILYALFGAQILTLFYMK